MAGSEIAYDEDSKALAALLGEVLDDIPSVGEIVQNKGVSIGAAQAYRDAMSEVLRNIARSVTTSIEGTKRFSTNVEAALSALQAADADAAEQARAIFSSMETNTDRMISSPNSNSSRAVDGGPDTTSRALGTSGISAGN